METIVPLLLLLFIILCLIIAGLTCIKYYTRRIQKQSAIIAEHEHRLAEAEKEGIRANLLRAISHDLRTPLTGIIGNSMAYLENSSLLTNDEKEDIVRNIYEDSTWLINMVENLLTITRIGTNDIVLNLTEEPVEEVVGEALQRLQKRYPDCKINVSIPDTLLLLPMDAMLIEQVSMNLLSNAYFHSDSNVPIDFIVENHPDNVSFTVRDYGKGIPADRLDHLFDGKDYTMHTSDVHKGMGIGLVICKTIITAHKGTLIGRNHSQGAEFLFTLPKRTTDNE